MRKMGFSHVCPRLLDVSWVVSLAPMDGASDMVLVFSR